MFFSRNTLLTAVFALGTLAVVTQETEACRGRGGYSGGLSRSYSSHSYGGYSSSRYNYSRPAYGHGYSQPVQVVRPVQPVQGIQPQPVIGQQAPVQQISQPQFAAPQQQVQPQMAAPQQQVQPQMAAPQQQVQPQMAAPQQQVQPQTAAPQQQVQPQTAAPQQQTTPAPAQNNAAMSALQALGGFAPPQQSTTPQPQPQVQTPTHVGSWSATLGNGATVRLTLQADGNFSWVATNKSGSSSSFSGRYTVGNGSLTLNRSNDNQQLGGSMTTNGNNAFSFKVAGNNAASINFTRS